MGSLTGSGNPWGGDRERRTGWTEGLEIPVFNEESEVLYFSCCVPAYDRKMEKVARATSRILKETGARFGIIGNRESCCGESIRKAGNEEIFKTLATGNIELFKGCGVREIVVSSPHCYVTFKTEYPELGGEFKVRHFSQYLWDVIEAGARTFTRAYPKKVVYHDPCYLGRHGGIYDEPRNVLRSIPGLTLMDEVRAREESLCCGGGGGRMWLETQKGERFTDILVEQAVEMGAEVIATACPYCILNFKDSALSMDREDLEVLDVSEIVNEVI
jgi:Fe-S oxidoreductase